MTSEKQQQFGIDLTNLLNRYSAENDSDTPDFILAGYLIACLNNFHASVNSRRNWWGDKESSGFPKLGTAEQENEDLREQN